MSTAEPLAAPEVRRMRESDLDRVLGIERDSFSTPWNPSSFRNLLARRDADLWVAEMEGNVVGYAVVWYVADEAELGNLCVTRIWRRQGVGRQLLHWSLDNAQLRGARRLFLEVRVSNRSAQVLYERSGFVFVGWRRRYYRDPVEDARVMCLDLTGARSPDLGSRGLKRPR